MSLKFTLTNETRDWFGRTLHRIKALKNFRDVKAEELGGWVEKEENLSQLGDCWIYPDAKVYGDAKVIDNAIVYGTARVYGYARIGCDAEVFNDAWIYDNACILGNAKVYESATVHEKAYIDNSAHIHGYAVIYGRASIKGYANIERPDDMLHIFGIGSRYGSTTVYRDNNGGLLISCGCFFGTIDEFAKKVEKTHGDNKFGREYNAFIEMVKIHFGKE